MTSVSSMHDAGHPKLVLWGNPEGQDEEGGGKEVMTGGGVGGRKHVYLWLIHGDAVGQKVQHEQ